MQKKEIVVIGVGRFGRELVDRLKPIPGISLVAIDSDPSKLESLGIKNIIVGDATDEEWLKSLGIDNADFFIIGMGQDFQTSLIIASTIKNNFGGLIIAKSVSEQHELILNKIGVNDVVTPEIAAAVRTFHKILNPLEIKGKNQFEMNQIFDDVSLVRVPVKNKWSGQMIKEINLSKDIAITMIFKGGTKPQIVSGDTVLEEDDILAIAGKDKILLKELNIISKEFDEEEVSLENDSFNLSQKQIIWNKYFGRAKAALDIFGRPMTKDEFQLDHIYPKSMGGFTITENAIPLHEDSIKEKSSDLSGEVNGMKFVIKGNKMKGVIIVDGEKRSK